MTSQKFFYRFVSLPRGWVGLLAGWRCGCAVFGAVVPSPIPRPDHVLVVVEENRSPNGVVASSHAPYIGSLAQRGAVFTEYFAIDHPSQANYVVIFSGATQGVSDDSCPHHFNAPNLGSELIAAGLTFSGYAEGLPGIGSSTCESGQYVRRHAPWVNFLNVPARLNKRFADFPSDYSQLPTVSFVVPNLDNDMHDGTTERADAWMMRNIDPYVQWAQTNNSLLIITWDEGATPNQVAAIFVGPMVQPGTYCERLSHYNLARTLEEMFELPYAGLTANVPPIADVWVTGNPPPSAVLQEPADAAAFVAPTDITLTAEASGVVPIQKVEFFAGAAKLGESTVSPYTFLWRNASPGTWCLRAKAIDVQGGMLASPNVIITVTGTASNLFLAAKGKYSGVLVASNPPPATNVGSFTLKTTARGAFSGRLSIDGKKFALQGKFFQDGSAVRTIKRRGQPVMTVELDLDLFSATGEIRGSVNDGTRVVTLDGQRVVATTSTTR